MQCAHFACAFSKLPFITMAITDGAPVRAAAHAARLAVHAASGLAWSADLPDVARCLRAAEGAVRAALAQLHADPPRHQGAENFAEKKAPEGEKKAPRKRRKRRSRNAGEAQQRGGEAAAVVSMDVDDSHPLPEQRQQESQLEQKAHDQQVTAEAQSSATADAAVEERQHTQAVAKARGFFQQAETQATAPQKTLLVYEEIEKLLSSGVLKEEEHPLGPLGSYTLEAALLELHARHVADFGLPGAEGRGKEDRGCSSGKGRSAKEPRLGVKR